MTGEILEILKTANIDDGDSRLLFTAVQVEELTALVTIQLLTYDDGGIRSIKEQEVNVPAPLLTPSERLRAFAEAHKRALAQVFKGGALYVETLMPMDLVHFGVLELKRPQSVEEFEQALLSKKRLGAFCNGE